MLSTIYLISAFLIINCHLTDGTDDKYVVCETEECKRFAQMIKENMNDSVDPCTNFHEYACGRWPINHPIPQGITHNNMFKEFRQIIELQVTDILKADPLPSDILPLKMVKKSFKACMDVEARERQGVEPLVTILSQIGGWPLTLPSDEWNESEYTWQKVDDYYANLIGMNSFHQVEIIEEKFGNKDIVLDVPIIPESTWVLNAETWKVPQSVCLFVWRNGRYWKYVTQVVQEIIKAKGSVVDAEELEKDIENMLLFQYKLEKCYVQVNLCNITAHINRLKEEDSNILLRSNVYTKMTLSSFQKWYDSLNSRTDNSKVNWINKVINLFKEAGIETIQESTEINLISPEYFGKLILLLDESPSRVIVNYLHWNFIIHSIRGTNRKFKKLTKNLVTFLDITLPSDMDLHGSNECIMEGYMNDIILHSYLQKYLPNDAENEVLEISDNIQRELERQIETSNWADNTIKSLALRKLRGIKKYIGYPKWVKNTTFLIQRYKDLHIGENHFENFVNEEKFTNLEKLRMLLTTENDMAEWPINFVNLHPFYCPIFLYLYIPAPFLQNPYFNVSRTDAINYAIFGFMVSHSMAHGYDDLCDYLDENGNRIQWSPSMVKAYDKGYECSAKKFNKYVLDTLSSYDAPKNYRNLTIKENMADIMGLDAAFEAYQRKKMASNEPIQVLPGLETLNDNQVFFLAFANTFCDAITPKYMIQLAQFYPRSIGTVRISSTLSNIEGFAQAFNCSVKDSEKRCNMWHH